MTNISLDKTLISQLG